MQIQVFWLLLLSGLCAASPILSTSISSTSSSSDNGQLMEVLSKIEELILASSPISPSLSTQDHAVLLRTWFSTCHLPTKIIYKMSRKHSSGLQEDFSHLARLSLPTIGKHEGLMRVMGKASPTSGLLLYTSYVKVFYTLESYREKKRYLRKNVYCRQKPPQLRLLLRAICNLLFNSLDYAMLSPSLKDFKLIRDARSAFQTSTHNYHQLLEQAISNANLELWNIKPLLIHSIHQVMELERRYIEELLGSLLTEQLELFNRNLDQLALGIAKMLDGEEVRFDSLEYFENIH